MMILPLLGADTEIGALGMLMREEHCKRGVVASVITWICANCPEKIGEFITAYGTPAEVYEACREWSLPETISKHFGIHDKIEDVMNPMAKLCRGDPRVASLDLYKVMLQKAPVQDLQSADKGSWGEYSFNSEEDMIANLQAYFADAHWEILFVRNLDESYEDWIEDHWEHTDGFANSGKQKRTRRKKVPPLRRNVKLTEVDMGVEMGVTTGVGSPMVEVIKDYHITITSGTKSNDWVVKLYKGSSHSNGGHKIADIGTFTVNTIVKAKNYTQITTAVSKLPNIKTTPEEVKA